MRTTVTLDTDTEAAVRRLMRERGLTFKAAVNHAIRAGSLAAQGKPRRFKGTAFRMGEPLVPLDGALSVVAELEDAELFRRLSARK